MTELQRNFILFENSVNDANSKSQTPNEVAKHWIKVELCSSAKCSNEIYANPASCLPDKLSLSRVNLERENIVEKLLPSIVNDPLAILWGTFGKLFHINTALDVDISVDGYRRKQTGILVGDIDSATFLDDYWFRDGLLPILWGAEIEDFHSAVRIICENILFHNRSNRKISWGMSMNKVNDSTKLLVWVANNKDGKRHKGRGQGLPQIRLHLERMRGEVKEQSDENKYKIELNFPCDYINLRATTT